MSFIIKTTVFTAALMALESLLLKERLPVLYAASPVLPFLPRLYGLVLLVNVLGSSLLVLVLGFRVGRARARCIEKAKKDGDAEAEARFSYPKMYAEGFSAEAKTFNCVQRSHQQIFETYTQFVACSLLGGVCFPLCAALGGLLWAVARLQWAQGYCKGEPSQRYESVWAFGIWSGLLVQFILAAATSIATLGVFSLKVI